MGWEFPFAEVDTEIVREGVREWNAAVGDVFELLGAFLGAWI